MFICTACEVVIDDGQDMTIVTDAQVFNSGEVEHLNTNHFHSACIVVDY